jgi:hypothetical protein
MSVLVVRNFESHIYQAIAVPVKARVGWAAIPELYSAAATYTLLLLCGRAATASIYDRAGGQCLKTTMIGQNGELLVTVAFRSDWR